MCIRDRSVRSCNDGRHDARPRRAPAEGRHVGRVGTLARRPRSVSWALPGVLRVRDARTLCGIFATAPASERQGLLPVAGLVGVVVVLAVWFLKRGFSRRLFVLAGVVLMALGAMVGAALPA